MQDPDTGNNLTDHNGPPSRTLFKAVAYLLLVAIAVIGITYYMDSDPEQAVRDQFSLFQNGKVAEAYYMYMDNNYRAHHSLEEFQYYVEQHPVLTAPGSIGIFESSKSGNLTLLRGKFDASNEGVIPVDILLTQESGKWKIDSIDFPKISLSSQPFSPSSASSTSSESPLRKTSAAAPLSIDAKADPRDTVIRQLEALRANKFAESYYGVVSKAFQAETSLDEFEQFVRNYPILSKHKEVVVTSVSQEGGQAVVKATLDPSGNAIMLEFKLAKEEGLWHIWSLRLIFPAGEAKHYPVFEMMAEPVLQQLTLLQRNDIGAAYRNFTSLPFRRATSLESFTTFVNKFPAFQQNNKVELKDRTIQNNMGKFRVALYGTAGITLVEYTLGQEGDAWKIWGLQIISAPKATINPAPTSLQQGQPSYRNFNSSDLSKTIDQQLEALKNNDIAKAYYTYTSKEFQKATPYKEFEAFVLATPILTQEHTNSFTKLVFNNNIATFSGILIDANGVEHPIEYDLIEQDGQWKVLQILAFPVAEATQEP